MQRLEEKSISLPGIKLRLSSLKPDTILCYHGSVNYCCCSYQCGKMMSLNCSHQLACCSLLYMSTESHGGMMLTGETEKLGEKPVPAPLHPPQTPHGLTRMWTLVFAVRDQWLTAQPHHCTYFCFIYILYHCSVPLYFMLFAKYQQ
jgi:hypothetical protein